MNLKVLATVIFVVVFALGCSKPKSDEEILRAIVEDVADGAREKDVKRVLGRVSKNYHDDKAGDYNGVKGIVLYHFMRGEKLSVFVRDIEIEVEGEKALINVRVVFVLGKEVEKITDVVPEEMSAVKFSVVFKKEDGDWKAITAMWDETGVLGLI